jgi:hypothetical protein
MAKAGRKSKYDEYVKPYLNQIAEWKKSGASDKEISDALDVALSTFSEYKNQYSELSDALRTGKKTVVLNVKAALYKKAIGFEYEEMEGIKKEGKVVSTKIVKRYAPPDTTAAAMILRNYDEEYRDKDSVQTDFKRQEIEIKKALAEANNFGVEFD